VGWVEHFRFLEEKLHQLSFLNGDEKSFSKKTTMSLFLFLKKVSKSHKTGKVLG
jgi:hypothetical protein